MLFYTQLVKYVSSAKSVASAKGAAAVKEVDAVKDLAKAENSSRQLGFTLIEILVVATIIIVLSTIGMVSYQQAGVRARNGKRRADMETVRQSLVLYRTDNSAYPIGSNFNTMVTTISSYVSATQINDPKNVVPYVYAYSSADGKTFTLTWYEEPSATANSISNP